MHKFEITNAEGGTAFLVQVAPGSKSNKITSKDSDVVYVSLTSEATHEAVNRDIVSFLAETLGLEREKIAVAAGTSVEKMIVIIMGMPPEQIEAKLTPK